MTDNPISNPGVTPTPKVPPYGPDKPMLGEGEQAQEPKPFALPPEPLKESSPTVSSDKPSPMDAAREGMQQQAQMTPAELNEKLSELKNRLGEVNNQLQNPTITGRFNQDHLEALSRLTDKMNPDLQTIAKQTASEFKSPLKTAGEPILSFVTRWLDGTQQTLTKALDYVSQEKSPNPAAFLKLQYSVQRATQRGELFSSIIGASVSGIKTIMSTQLG